MRRMEGGETKEEEKTGRGGLWNNKFKKQTIYM